MREWFVKNVLGIEEQPKLEFGIKEAKALREREKKGTVDINTVHAMLNIMKVRNVLAEQIKEVTDKLRVVIYSFEEETQLVTSKDREDKKKTKDQIEKIWAEGEGRNYVNESEINKLMKEISKVREEVDGTLSLIKYGEQ